MRRVASRAVGRTPDVTSVKSARKTPVCPVVVMTRAAPTVSCALRERALEVTVETMAIVDLGSVA